MRVSEIRESINNLIMLGVISVDEEIIGFTEDDAEVVRRTYMLTPKGRDFAEEIIEKLPEEIRKVLPLLRKFNEMPLKRLNDYCHIKYGKKWPHKPLYKPVYFPEGM